MSHHDDGFTLIVVLGGLALVFLAIGLGMPFEIVFEILDLLLELL